MEWTKSLSRSLSATDAMSRRVESVLENDAVSQNFCLNSHSPLPSRKQNCPYTALKTYT